MSCKSHFMVIDDSWNCDLPTISVRILLLSQHDKGHLADENTIKVKFNDSVSIVLILYGRRRSLLINSWLPGLLNNWKTKNGGVSDGVSNVIQVMSWLTLSCHVDQSTIQRLLHNFDSGKLKEAIQQYDKAVEAYENGCQPELPKNGMVSRHEIGLVD